jgi:hypothetical protein
MNRPVKPISPAQAEAFLVAMHRRDLIASLQQAALDMTIIECELAVDAAFARAGFTPPSAIASSGVQRP